jgi:hypothetical protein
MKIQSKIILSILLCFMSISLIDSANAADSTEQKKSANTPEIIQLAPSAMDTLTLTWLPVSMNTPANKVRYAIHVSTTENFTPDKSTLRQTVVGKNQATFSGLNADTTYYVLIIAADPKGNVINGTQYMSATTFNAPLMFNLTTPAVNSDTLKLGKHTQKGNTLTFTKTAGTKAPPVNSVLISHDGNGYYLIRRVDNVTVLGSKINVATSQASLSDVLDQGTISSHLQLFDASNAGVTQSNGNRVSKMNLGSRITTQQTDYAYQDEQLSITTKNSSGKQTIVMKQSADEISEAVHLDASIAFVPKFETDIRWSAGGVESGRLIARGTLSLDANIIYDFRAASSYNPAPKTLFTRSFVSLLQVGALPVYQETTLTVKAKISAKAAAAINASTHANLKKTLTVGVIYNAATGQWEAVINEDEKNTLEAQLNINGDVQAEIRLIPEIKVKLYRTVAATFSLEPYLAGDIHEEQITSDPNLLLAIAPRMLAPTRFNVDLGLESYVSADLSMVYRDISLLKSKRIEGIKKPLFSLPILTLQTDSNNQTKNLTLHVTDGVNNHFDPNSIKWEAISNTTKGQITDNGCTQNASSTGYECHASLTDKNAENYQILASGFGVLGEVARQYALGGYTKIANDGSELPDSAILGTKPKDWACTKDNKTGLIWEVKTSDGGLRDKSKTYTNYTPDYPQCEGADCEKYFPGKYGDSTNTDGFVKVVNATSLCGASNWRLPTKDEGILDVDWTYFPNTKKEWFWSSSPNVSDSKGAWDVSFDFVDSADSGFKGFNGNVRLVH